MTRKGFGHHCWRVYVWVFGIVVLLGVPEPYPWALAELGLPAVPEPPRTNLYAWGLVQPVLVLEAALLAGAMTVPLASIAWWRSTKETEQCDNAGHTNNPPGGLYLG